MYGVGTDATRTQLIEEIGNAIVYDTYGSVFTDLFQRTCAVLELDERQAAKVFDMSIPNVRRWLSGEVVPPASKLMMSFMLEELEKDV